MTVSKVVNETGSMGTIAVLGQFVSSGLQHIAIWLFVMLCVIVCDLAFGVRRALIMKEVVRVSRAFRDTMGKIVTYFAFVIMVVFVKQAAEIELPVDNYSCLFIVLIEAGSIFNNMLRPMGYDINIAKLLSLLGGKLTHIDSSALGGVITKEDTNINEKEITK
jgi:hypothetical protein